MADAANPCTARDQAEPPLHEQDDERRPFEPHEGEPCPYRPGDRVDVQFGDGRVEHDATAGWWMNRVGIPEGFWSWEHPEPSKHIIRHRLAGDVSCREGLETDLG